MARKLLAFGFEIVACDPYVSAGYMRTCGVTKVALDDVLARAQLVCVMCPYTPETHQLLNAAAFARMRPGAMLVNTTRGKIVDNHALHDALTTGHLAMAALDDTEEEPAKRRTLVAGDQPALLASELLHHAARRLCFGRSAHGMPPRRGGERKGGAARRTAPEPRAALMMARRDQRCSRSSSISSEIPRCWRSSRRSRDATARPASSPTCSTAPG